MVCVTCHLLPATPLRSNRLLLPGWKGEGDLVPGASDGELGYGFTGEWIAHGVVSQIGAIRVPNGVPTRTKEGFMVALGRNHPHPTSVLVDVLGDKCQPTAIRALGGRGEPAAAAGIFVMVDEGGSARRFASGIWLRRDGRQRSLRSRSKAINARLRRIPRTEF